MVEVATVSVGVDGVSGVASRFFFDASAAVGHRMEVFGVISSAP